MPHLKLILTTRETLPSWAGQTYLSVSLPLQIFFLLSVFKQ
jgi:hypothetical protein